MTTTDLRTKTPELVRLLTMGNSVSIIHRSEIIGTIQPAEKTHKVLTETDILELKKLVDGMNLPHLSDKEREKRYRRHLMEKYG